MRAQEYALHSFERQQLTDVYYSEGIAAGDLNRDGHVDIVYGPYWFAGPSFQERHEIYSAKPQPRERYADHFFAWVYDFNGDGWNDVLTAGFPGTPAFVYENPRADGHWQPWRKHQVLDSVSNESPQFVNIVGDEQPELVCTHEGFFGYATFDPAQPLVAWTFHPISEKVAPVPFGHGLGIGDVNGDGKGDILMKDGWFEQPSNLGDSVRWSFQRAKFTTTGGAEMYAYDVDGDGDNDVITSLAAHDFGVVWHEQVREGDKIAFRQHTIVGDEVANNRYGVLFSEPHSVNLADIDGDGLKDIVTGKTYWSHHTKSPLWDAGAVVYWFRLVRGPNGVDWVPNKADGDSGIGRQLIVHDMNQDGLLDIAAGGMKGANVLLHQKTPVTETAWKAAQPKVRFEVAKPYVFTPPTPAKK
ncbi:MAG TPA: VCBS repeat-containing protein [Pirellulaceae bacterium]